MAAAWAAGGVPSHAVRWPSSCSRRKASRGLAVKPPATNTTAASSPLALCIVRICTASRSLSMRCTLASSPNGRRLPSTYARSVERSSRSVGRERTASSSRSSNRCWVLVSARSLSTNASARRAIPLSPRMRANSRRTRARRRAPSTRNRRWVRRWQIAAAVAPPDAGEERRQPRARGARASRCVVDGGEQVADVLGLGRLERPSARW